MRLCLLSDLPLSATPGNPAITAAEIFPAYVAFLSQQGHEVYWLSTPALLHAPVIQAALLPATAELMPTTCRYVMPVQAYWYAGARLLCIPLELWQRVDMHTRLFTFLCLLHRARACTLFHAWSTLPIAYLTVYTARYLALPAIVSCPADTPEPGPADVFRQDWTAQHAAAYVVHSPAVSPAGLDLARLHVINPAQARASQTLLALYRRFETTAP
ncbi:MAG: hypothetical protein AB7N91_11525 [Candidatus Tectimicrobiota bacterium]